jgi:hypothetical protein
VTIAIAVFSILSLVWSMLRPPDSGGMRADSYGTRGNGYRALFESLDELNVPVRRQLGPPLPNEFPESLLVLWDPRPDLTNADPKWLRGVAGWLRQGGQAVVAFDDEAPLSLFSTMRRGRASEKPWDDDDVDDETDPEIEKLPKPTLFELLGVGKLEITGVDEADELDEGHTDTFPPPPTGSKGFPEDEDLVDTFREVLTASSRPEEANLHIVEAAGEFASLIPEGSRIELPIGLLYEINVEGRDLRDTIHVVTESGTRHCIAARLPVGQGHVTVVSIRRLISNENIDAADNIVVAAGLLLAPGREIVFDEFYHGVTIRGNPMWLFSTKTYGSVTAMLLLLLAVAIWRAAIFLGPPVAEAPVRRRSIREYIDAMSRFLREGKGHREWSLEHVRDGVLWKLRREFGLPSESHDDSRLTAAMARKDPRRAEHLIEVLNEVDAALNMPRFAGERRIGQLVQRMTECLSKTDIKRSEPKSQK